MAQEQHAADVVIVGGGTAGCVLAARLSENEDRSVSLVEAGPDYGSRDDGGWPPEMVDATSGPDTHDWIDDEGSLPVARVIGGCSAHNLCFAVRGAAEDYDEWTGPGGEDWSAETLAPCFALVDEALALRRPLHDEVDPWLRTVISAGPEVGLPVHEDIDPAGPGVGPMPMNVDGRVRVHAGFAYLDQARGRSNLEIRDQTRVDRVLVEGGRCKGVAARGPDGPLQLLADTVILAAGAYLTPAILMRSGIGPEKDLRSHGIDVVEALPVGTRLRDHFGLGIRFRPTAEMERLIAAYEADHLLYAVQGLVKTASPDCEPGLWDMHLVLGVFADEGEAGARGSGAAKHLLSSTAMLLQPEWTGSVTLRSAAPDELPVVADYALDSERDLASAEHGLQLARAIAGSGAAEGLIGEELAPGRGVSGARARERGREALSAYFHPCGTAPLGEVVDSRAEVHGVAGLHVGDASMFPSIPRANTNLTVLAAAERLSKLLDR